MGLTEKSMLERWEIAKIEARLDKAKSIKQQKVCCISNTADDEAQAIDVEPVKHAYWEEKQDMDGDTYYRCTNCGEGFVFEEGTPKDNLYYYCPYCGAKMDLKKGENE